MLLRNEGFSLIKFCKLSLNTLSEILRFLRSVGSLFQVFLRLRFNVFVLGFASFSIAQLLRRLYWSFFYI